MGKRFQVTQATRTPDSADRLRGAKKDLMARSSPFAGGGLPIADIYRVEENGQFGYVVSRDGEEHRVRNACEHWQPDPTATDCPFKCAQEESRHEQEAPDSELR